VPLIITYFQTGLVPSLIARVSPRHDGAVRSLLLTFVLHLYNVLLPP